MHSEPRGNPAFRETGGKARSPLRGLPGERAVLRRLLESRLVGGLNFEASRIVEYDGQMKKSGSTA
jgi:hypothetical protein